MIGHQYKLGKGCFCKAQAIPLPWSSQPREPRSALFPLESACHCRKPVPCGEHHYRITGWKEYEPAGQSLLPILPGTAAASQLVLEQPGWSPQAYPAPGLLLVWLLPSHSGFFAAKFPRLSSVQWPPATHNLKDPARGLMW